MRRTITALALSALGLLAAAAPALADPPAAVLLLSETRVFGTLRRAPVRFTHEYHAGAMSCLTCHHDFKNGKNVLDPGRLTPGDPSTQCAACHVTPAALQQAFHGQCITCHDLQKRRGPPAAPRVCGECHVWQR